ncbi:MAG: TetR/AcrR family transcriptional regulator [Deltaproteobacteria bacterium]|nr:TetR/AcrR family transcriptional regulator [Deltaproteobacteria bacterium]MBW2419649.1 TetR/AcrR family transcriptional regulator [Deltaproteobacteria bacterium]
MAQASPQPTRRAQRTRRVLLEEAERLFAENGFEATRLEDVATAVGIRRASIVYHFKDKRELYDAVLADVFSAYHAELASIFDTPGPLRERIEDAVRAWVDFVFRRPSLARILLREIANAGPAGSPAVRTHIQPFWKLIQRFIEENKAHEGSTAIPIDAVYIAGAIAGCTVFFVTTIPSVAPELGFAPEDQESLERHRDEVLRLTRLLLGVEEHSESGG